MILDFAGKDMACRPDPLRVGRSLRDGYTPLGAAPVGRLEHILLPIIGNPCEAVYAPRVATNQSVGTP
jgi:hypothetical protein